MNKFTTAIIASAASCASFTSLAQNTGTTLPSDAGTGKIIKPATDMFMLQLGYEGWGNNSDSIKTKAVSRGIGAYILNDFKIKNSNFSFAAGIGFYVSNIFFKNQRANLSTGGSSIAFPSVNTSSSSDQYKGMKYKTTYLEAPLEFRFYGDKDNRNRGLKIAIGAKVGYLMGASSKYKKTVTGTSNFVTYKENSKNYAATWRFEPMVRVGWGNFSLFGAYSATTLFNSGEGPAVHPFSIGLTISGL